MDAPLNAGLVRSFARLGNFIAPPLGSSLASIDPGLSFILCGGLVVVPLLILRFVKRNGNESIVAGRALPIMGEKWVHTLICESGHYVTRNEGLSNKAEFCLLRTRG